MRRAAALVIALMVTAGATTAAAQALEMAPVAAAADDRLPPDYVIGADDVLTIQFWSEKDMSAEVTVRPDGKIALPLLNDVPAAGLTPEELRDRLLTAARKFVENPNPTVMVKTINSRKVFITGQIEKPGTYPINHSLTVLQLIALAGGLREFVQGKNISVLRQENDRQVVYRFNYRDVINAKNLEQNIQLKPGDTIDVP
jgi:polysaccharide export outer membrane protein